MKFYHNYKTKIGTILIEEKENKIAKIKILKKEEKIEGQRKKFNLR